MAIRTKPRLKSRRTRATAATSFLLSLLVTLNPMGIGGASATTYYCHGTGCRSLDPSKYNCGSASTVAQDWLDNEAVVELRYSATCNTFWARFKKDDFNCCVQVTLREEQDKYVAGEWEGWWAQDKTITWDSTLGVWTPMNPNESNDRHKACIVWPDGDQECTGWVTTG